MTPLEHILTIYQEPLFWLFPVVSGLISMGAFMLFAAPMTWVAWWDPAWLRPYRIQDRRPRRANLISLSLKYWLMNNTLTLAVFVALWPLLRLSGVHAGEFPPWYVVLLQLAVLIYLDDFLYYWVHRSMHTNRWLFQRIHSVHHRVRTPWAISGHMMHPVEYLTTGTLMLIGPLLLGVHVGVFWIWVVLRQWEASEGHCGYDIPWSPTHFLPGGDGARHHDFHHARVRGNFAGFLAYLDGWFGTYAPGYPDEGSTRRASEAQPSSPD